MRNKIQGLTFRWAIGFLFLFNIVAGQNTFVTTFQGSGDQDGIRTVNTFDGNYITAGSKTDFSPGFWDMYLIKTKNNGDTLWTKTYGGIKEDVAYDVIETHDGGYLISGYTYSFGPYAGDSTKAYVIRTDNNGDTLWTRIYGGNGNEVFWKSFEQADGSFVCFGSTTSFGINGDIYVLHINSNGDTLLSRHYGTNNPESIQNCIRTSDKGYLIIGNTSDNYLVKLDSLFNIKWSKSYGGAGSEYISGACLNSNGNVVICGVTSSFGNVGDYETAYTICINSIGDTVWTKCYGFENYNVFTSVIETTDHNILLAGLTLNLTVQHGKGLFIKVSAITGDTIWSELNGLNNGAFIEPAFDGGAIITGQIIDTVNSLTKLYINKTGITFETGCNPQRIKARVMPTQTSVQNVATQVHSTATKVWGTQTKVSSGGTVVNTLCSTNGIEKLGMQKAEVRMWPNPANGVLTIELKDEEIKDIRLTDVLGKEVFVARNKSQEPRQIDISGLSEGVYFIEITTGEGRLTQKIIKQ